VQYDYHRAAGSRWLPISSTDSSGVLIVIAQERHAARDTAHSLPTCLRDAREQQHVGPSSMIPYTMVVRNILVQRPTRRTLARNGSWTNSALLQVLSSIPSRHFRFGLRAGKISVLAGPVYMIARRSQSISRRDHVEDIPTVRRAPRPSIVAFRATRCVHRSSGCTVIPAISIEYVVSHEPSQREDLPVKKSVPANAARRARMIPPCMSTPPIANQCRMIGLRRVTTDSQ
jgi:hypothetical protein